MKLLGFAIAYHQPTTKVFFTRDLVSAEHRKENHPEWVSCLRQARIMRSELDERPWFSWEAQEKANLEQMALVTFAETKVTRRRRNNNDKKKIIQSVRLSSLLSP